MQNKIDTLAVLLVSLLLTACDGDPISLDLGDLAVELTLEDIDGLSNEVGGRFIKESSNSFLAADAFAARLGTTGTDYLTGGYWLYATGSAANPVLEIGAFTDGPDSARTPSSYWRARR